MSNRSDIGFPYYYTKRSDTETFEKLAALGQHELEATLHLPIQNLLCFKFHNIGDRYHLVCCGARTPLNLRKPALRPWRKSLQVLNHRSAYR